LSISLDSAPVAVSERPPFAISPDGGTLVYVGMVGNTPRLFQRRLDSLQIHPIPDTEDASGPFFSPDGEMVGFFTGFDLRRVALAGGASKIIGEAPAVTRGASWAAGDEIFVTPSSAHGLARVSEEGLPTMVSRPDANNDQKNHSWPQVLPGGKHALVSIQRIGRESYDAADVAVVDLETGEVSVVVEGGYHARYVPTGHLVFMTGGSLMAAPFSLSSRKTTGPPVQILDDVMTEPRTGAAYFAFSETGTLVYAAGAAVRVSERRMVWVGRDGSTEPVTEKLAVYSWPRLSPDGSRIAVAIEGANDDVWLYDLGRGTFTRFTFEGRNIAPLWTPDGTGLTFSSTLAGDPRIPVPNLLMRSADGSGDSERLWPTSFASFAGAWTPDGGKLVFMGLAADEDILVGARDDDAPSPLLASRFREMCASLSPDGRWLAYASDESGRSEVYLRPFPGPGAKVQVSTEGGDEPVWAKSGRELFYRNRNQVVAANISTGQKLAIGEPEVLFERSFDRSPIPGLTNYDVSKDGRFLMIEPSEHASIKELNVVLDWFDELERLVPPVE